MHTITTKQKPRKATAEISVIQTRVKTSLRKKSDLILKRLGLSTPDAIRLFLEQVVLHRGIPFDVRIPDNAAVLDTDWNEDTELQFQSALDSIDKKFGKALKNLADMA